MFSMIEMIKMMIAAFLATVGFAIIFNIRGKKAVFASLGASLAAIVYYLGTYVWLWNDFICLFSASIVFSIYAEVMARVLKAPVTTFIICALICYVPGGTMYYTMVELIQGNSGNAGQLLLEALIAAAALAIGIACVSTLTRLVFKIKNRRIKL